MTKPQTYTLVSAFTGEQAPGDELNDALTAEQLKTMFALPEVDAFCQAHQYDPDHPNNCMYLVEGEYESRRWETLTFTLPEQA